MKIVLFSDLHVNYKESNPIFVKIALDFIDYLKEYCLENNIMNVFFLGDIFEKSIRIRYDHFVPLFEKLRFLKKSGIKLTMILGNHDLYSNSNDSIVQTFSEITHCVVRDSFDAKYGGRDFHFLSYTRDVKKIPEKGDILITHLPIADFEFDNEYNANESDAFKKELFASYNAVFSGHFHKRQYHDNIWYIGSTYQLSLNEQGQQKGFLLLDTDDVLNPEFVPYKNAPEFIKIKVEDFNGVNVKNKFVYVEIENKIDNFIKLKMVLADRGALSVTPLFKPPKEDFEIGDVTIDRKLSSISDISVDYLKNVKIEGIDNDKLVALFYKVAERVK
jgi:DNA repair exonuclease SbcCD nuclease subunit